MNSTSEQDRAIDPSAPPRLGTLRLRDIERAAIEQTLAHTGNNQTKAAQILGISRPTLLRKLKGYRVQDAAAQMHRSGQAAEDFNAHCWPHMRDSR
jgi:DNA-binding NtrC family response regulator